MVRSFSCPNITCRAFGSPFDLDCWDAGECIGGYDVRVGGPYDHVGTPRCEDEYGCGGCGTHTIPHEEFETALAIIREGS